jgi:acetyltransferase-like isoleucine patch superfamily enzyme
VLAPVYRVAQVLRASLLKLRHGSAVSVGDRTYLSPGTISLARGGKLDIGRLNLWEENYYIGVRNGGHVSFANNVFLNRNVKIVCYSSIEIGEDCILADSVHIYDHDHGIDELDVPIRNQPMKSAPIVIKDNVWIGAKATVLKGVTIGTGAVVAAGAVVTRDVPPYAVVGGVPARVVKMRTVEEAKELKVASMP